MLRAAWICCAALVAFAADPSWKLAYSPAESPRFADIQVAPGCALAFGSVARGVVARSTDGGVTWSLDPLPDIPRTGFLLGPDKVWMVGESGIWRGSACGRKWEKVSPLDRLIRVYFLDQAHGYAAGWETQALETRDGGKTWAPLAASTDVTSAADRSYFHWLDFAGGRFGMIVGAHEPRRASEPGRKRRQLPSLLLTLQTIDGGAAWRGSSASILGQVTRVRLAPNGAGLAVVEFQDGFEWPSEVYRLDPAVNQMTRVFREANRAVKDALTLESGESYIASIEPPGRDWRLPVPGKVRIARSSDLAEWKEMPVDYRAVAGRVILASVPGGPVLAATDAGMILRLDRE